MPRKSPYRIRLVVHERTQLESLARKYTSPYRDVVRARILLYAAELLTNEQIAARLDTPRQIVSKWRKRFFEERVAGLEEGPRQRSSGTFFPLTWSLPLRHWRVSYPTSTTSRWRAGASRKSSARSFVALQSHHSARPLCGAD